MQGVKPKYAAGDLVEILPLRSDLIKFPHEYQVGMVVSCKLFRHAHRLGDNLFYNYDVYNFKLELIERRSDYSIKYKIS
jgi:hypothetical protein